MVKRRGAHAPICALRCRVAGSCWVKPEPFHVPSLFSLFFLFIFPARGVHTLFHTFRRNVWLCFFSSFVIHNPSNKGRGERKSILHGHVFAGNHPFSQKSPLAHKY